jgi:predicted ribosomally synthesized peptide with nif11-like leader
MFKGGVIYMSIESAELFIKRIETDEAFAEKVTACKDAKERKTLIHKAGFDFTATELREAGTVLSDNDLEYVAGGGGKWVQPDKVDINLTFN